MFKNHSIEWIIQRLTAIWSIVFIFSIFYLFIINFKTTLIDVVNGNSLVLIFWNSLAVSPEPDINIFSKIFIFSSFILLYIHMFQGIVNVLQDYIHNEKTKFFGQILILIIQIFSLKYLYIFLFF